MGRRTGARLKKVRAFRVPKSLPQVFSVTIASVVLAAFAWAVWPTLYRYDHMHSGSREWPVRINRFSGEADMLFPDGWGKLAQSPPDTSAPSMAPAPAYMDTGVTSPSGSTR